MATTQIATLDYMRGPICHDHGITGYGSPKSGLMFIGIAPGRQEVNTGRPFAGPSGKQLDNFLSSINISRNDVYCTNLICWWKDAPTSEDIAPCNDRLLREIELVNPRIIVLMGKIVTEYMLGIPFSRARGVVLLRNNRYVISTNHPAALLHRAKTPIEKELQINAAYDMCRDFSKLPDILAGKYPPSLYVEPTYTVINDPDEAQNVLDDLTGETVAIDVETSFDKEWEKEHPFDHDLLCIGIGNSDHAYVLTRSCLDNLVWPTNTTWIYHNGAFDTQEIRRILNVQLPISQDTMLMSYSVDERSIRGLHKLKPLAREFCGADFYEENEHKSDLQELYKYNAKDVVYTHRLYNVLTEWQQQEDTQGMYNDILLPAAEMLARSQYRGIYIDPVAIEEIEVTLGVEYVKLHKELSRLAGVPDFNPNSPAQVKVLMESMGYPVASTNKATLNDILDHEDVPFLSKLLRYRMLAKLLTTYLWPTKAQIKYDGRAHPHSFLIGTVTGRLTYKDPPMQTLPKEKTVGELGIVRKIFAATNNNYVLLEADYEQIEAHIAQYLSGDPVLYEDIHSGSWHDNTTMDVFKITKSSVSAQRWAFYRDGGKHLNYGCLFEEGPQGLTRRPPIGLGCSYQEALEYHKRWYQRYHVFDEWRHHIKEQAIRDGYVVTPTGRKRRFPIIVNDHQQRQIVNSPIQSLANEYTLLNAIRLEEPLRELDTHLLLLEHDGTYLEALKANLPQVTSLLKLRMQEPPLPGLPSIPIKIMYGPNLAELDTEG